jgi:hypothetical protein
VALMMFAFVMFLYLLDTGSAARAVEFRSAELLSGHRFHRDKDQSRGYDKSKPISHCRFL